MPSLPDPSPLDVLREAPPGSRWCVVHARPRCEKKVTEFCRRQGFAAYLPLQRRLHRYGARERIFLFPLFTGYVFCTADLPFRSTLRQNRHVANVLDVVEQESLLAQLRSIALALAVGDVVEVMPYLEVGKAVRICHGPMKGVEGVILRRKGRARIVINVDMIREAVAVEVDTALLGPA